MERREPTGDCPLFWSPRKKRGLSPSGRARRAFTLVELLVVITIIIILMGLLTPVVFIAISRAKEARILLEISTLDSAFKAYKEKHGSYPPSDFANIGTAKLVSGVPTLNLPAPNSPQYIALANHLSKAFPRCNVTTEIATIILSNPNYPKNVPAPVSPAQAIYFWLSGFCTDPEQPISGLLASLPRETSFFPFDATRLSYPNLPNSAAPVYCAADTPATPYVYFASQSYVSHATGIYTGPRDFGILGLNKNLGTPFDPAVWGQGGQGILRPYAADPVPSAGGVPTPVNPNSFQIISSGLDGNFGGGGITDNGAKGNPVIAYFPSGSFYASADKDNLTNFSKDNLGDSIPK